VSVPEFTKWLLKNAVDDVESAITNLPIRQDHQFVTGKEK